MKKQHFVAPFCIAAFVVALTACESSDDSSSSATTTTPTTTTAAWVKPAGFDDAKATCDLLPDLKTEAAKGDNISEKEYSDVSQMLLLSSSAANANRAYDNLQVTVTGFFGTMPNAAPVVGQTKIQIFNKDKSSQDKLSAACEKALAGSPGYETK